MVKICILTTVHKPFDTRIFYKEAKTLVGLGYQVTLIAQHDKDDVVDNVIIIPIPIIKNRIIRISLLPIWVLFLSLRQHADIYHFHDPEILPIGVLLNLLGRGKIIYDVHEDYPKLILTKYWIPSIFRLPIAIIFDYWEKFMAHFLDAVIVATETIAKEFSGFNPIILHNYPDLRMVPAPTKTSLCEKDSAFVYIGEISRLRGVFEVTRAFEYVNESLNARLDLIGQFQPSELEEEVKKLPGSRHVSFLGWLPWQRAWHEAQGKIAGLVLIHPTPNYAKSLPTKLFEYMAAGLPVIASNFPLWKEIVEGSQCGLAVDPLNPKEIAEAIKYLIMNPKYAQLMGQNGRLAISEKYNWEIEGGKLRKLYERLLMQ